MQLPSIIGAALVAIATAQNTSYPDIHLGSISYPHGSQYLAWSPFTPTKTTELDEVCNARGAIQGTATWTAIRTYNTYVYDPICRNPFNITDDSTNTTYYDLELACVDDNISLYALPEVTAVVDRATNKTVQTCTPVPSDSDVSRVSCSKQLAVVISYYYACKA